MEENWINYQNHFTRLLVTDFTKEFIESYNFYHFFTANKI